MKVSWRRWLPGSVALVLLVLIAAAAWLVTTQSGARWIMGRAEPYLPAALSLGDTSGSVAGGLRVSPLRWRDDASEIRIDSLSVRVAILPLVTGKLDIASLDAEGIDIQVFETGETEAATEPPRIEVPLDVSVSGVSLEDIRIRAGTVDRQIDTLRFSGSMTGSVLALERFELRSAWLEVDADTVATLHSPYPTRLTARWVLPDLATNPWSGQLSIDGTLEQYNVSHRLTAPAELATEATVGFPGGELYVDSQSEWDRWDVPLGDDRSLARSAGVLTLRGNADAYSLGGAVQVSLDGWPDVAAEVLANGSIDGLAIEALSLQTASGDFATSGNLDWQDGIGWDLIFAVTDFSPALVSEDLSGTLEASGSTRGRGTGDGPIAASLFVDRVGGLLNDYPVTGTVTADLADGVLTVTAGQLAVEDNQLTFSGAMDTSSSQAFDVSLEWVAPRLAALEESANGSTAGRLQASGSPDQWVVETDASASELEWGELRSNSLALGGTFGSDLAGQLTLDADAVQLGERSIERIHAVLEGDKDAHTISADVSGYGSRLVTRLSGALEEELWSGSVESLTADGELLGRWAASQPAALVIGAAKTQLDQLCLAEAGGEGLACVALSSTSGTGLDIDASIDGLPLAALPHGMPAAVEITGVLQANARLTQQDGLLNGELTSGLLGASLSTTYEGDRVSVAASEAAFRANVVQNRLTSSLTVLLDNELGRLELDLVVADVSSADSPLNSEARVAINDLSFAPLLVTAVTDVEGRLNGALRAGGRTSAIDYQGALRLQDGAFAVPAAGIRVDDVAMTLSQVTRGRLELEGSATSGDGRVSVSGYTEVSEGRELRAEVSVEGDNFQIARLPNWQASASPSVRVVVDRELTEVTGTIAIPQANLVFKDLPASANQPSNDTVVHGREDSRAGNGRRRSIDLQATLGDDVRLSGFGLTTGMSGSVRLRGGTRTPITGLGRLDLYDGRYRAYGQELEIERGALIFNGPLENPVLDVQAERRINSDIVAGITLAGTPRAPQSALYSEPGMSDAEILSYLVTGRPLNAASEGEGALLSQAAFALGVSGAGAIATQIGNTLGLDTLAVDGNADTGRIVAGKRLGDRLLVEYGYGLVDKLGTLLLRYELNDRVIIESSTGTASTLDVVYSIKKE